ncbi:MAG TPA: enoyl-CoA hydratase/isomerase family protein, partial [Paraburkholderia sp.]|uniref:enoyl-CoA hydratase/isomerase family protein n=1 Tax=Paraburkholderia sp. TaxID=1926495 RepID=UPI002B48D68D
LRLCRPAQANRLEPGDLPVLIQHFHWLRQHHAEVRVLVLTGTGKHFSAGFDLGAIDSAVEGNASEVFAEMVDTLEALPQTTICALNGGVFGGSTDLALACDFRMGVPATRMFMPAARFGLHYYASGLRRYLTRLGLNASKRLFLLAEEVSSQELLEIGYLTHIVPAEDLHAEAMELARRAAALGPLACAGMKAALNAMAADRYDAEEGARVYRACIASADMQEGIAALREKRAPVFNAR